eukprot:GSChrysophyteH1.ASY1.ANO1.85.1 assembled CDS
MGGNGSKHGTPESSDSYFDSVTNLNGANAGMSASGRLVYKAETRHKGLSNPLGENNCFLNVTVQLLWHLGPFRSELKRLINTSDGFIHVPFTTLEAAGGGERSLEIIDALCNLFLQYELSEKDVLPPDELRLTLSQISQQFELGRIADANEALMTILGRIHDDNASVCPDSAKCLSHFIMGSSLLEQSFCPECHATSEPSMCPGVFIHDVSAQGVIDEARAALSRERGARGRPKSSFGQLLRRAMGVAQKSCPSEDDAPPPSPACPSKANVRLICLDPPLALAISPSWSSNNVSADVLGNFYKLISKNLYLNEVFFTPVDDVSTSGSSTDTVNNGPVYLFRGMVCYYGLHYVSIFQENEDVNNYLLFDDQRVRHIGDFAEVVETAVKARYQPVLLLYEMLDTSELSSSSSLSNSYANTNSPVSGPSLTEPSGSVFETYVNNEVMNSTVSSPEDNGRNRGSELLSRGLPMPIASTPGPSSKKTQLREQPGTAGRRRELRRGEGKDSQESDLQRQTRDFERKGTPPAKTTVPPLIYASRLRIYEVHLSPVHNTFGFIPVLNEGAVLVGAFHHGRDGEALPAELAGVGLLDEILSVDGVEARFCDSEEAVAQLFKGKSSVRVRLRSSYQRSLTFYCQNCQQESEVTISDIENVRIQLQTSPQGWLVCDSCDMRHLIEDMDELDRAALIHIVKAS